MKSKIIFLTLALAGCGQNIEKTQKTDTEEHYNIKKPVDEFKQERLLLIGTNMEPVHLHLMEPLYWQLMEPPYLHRNRST